MSKYGAWKGTERRIARLLGGQRVGHQGGAIDVDAGRVVVQCKHRRRLPAWLVESLDKVRSAAGDHRLGVVVLHQHGQRADRDLVVMTLGDFQGWLGDGHGLQEDDQT